MITTTSSISITGTSTPIRTVLLLLLLLLSLPVLAPVLPPVLGDGPTVIHRLIYHKM